MCFAQSTQPDIEKQGPDVEPGFGLQCLGGWLCTFLWVQKQPTWGSDQVDCSILMSIWEFIGKTMGKYTLSEKLFLYSGLERPNWNVFSMIWPFYMPSSMNRNFQKSLATSNCTTRCATNSPWPLASLIVLGLVSSAVKFRGWTRKFCFCSVLPALPTFYYTSQEFLTKAQCSGSPIPSSFFAFPLGSFGF